MLPDRKNRDEDLYCLPQTNCFVVSQLFSVARHVRHLKKMRGRERERERETDRQRETETERQRESKESVLLELKMMMMKISIFTHAQ